jgi:hypothetical protein
MEEVPMLVDLRHLLEEFRKVAMGPLWGVLVEGNLLPSLLQIPPLLPKNLRSMVQISSDR